MLDVILVKIRISVIQPFKVEPRFIKCKDCIKCKKRWPILWYLQMTIHNIVIIDEKQHARICIII